MGSYFIFLNEGIWLSGPWGVSGSLLSPRGFFIATMRVVVLSASTGELVWSTPAGHSGRQEVGNYACGYAKPFIVRNIFR